MKESTDSDQRRASFSPGQLVHHLRFDYRGVVVDVDATFCGSDEWYEQVARSRPPKDAPWYHVLVDGAQHMTYVAEQNLEIDSSGESVSHPLLRYYFGEFRESRYVRKRRLN